MNKSRGKSRFRESPCLYSLPGLVWNCEKQRDIEIKEFPPYKKAIWDGFRGCEAERNPDLENPSALAA